MTSASSTKPQVERWAGAGLCEVADPLPGRPSQLAENQDGWRGGSRPESPSVLGGAAPPGRGVAASCWFIPETKAGLEAAPGILCASRRGETGRVLPGEGLGEGEAPPGHTWLPFCKILSSCQTLTPFNNLELPKGFKNCGSGLLIFEHTRDTHVYCFLCKVCVYLGSHFSVQHLLYLRA